MMTKIASERIPAEMKKRDKHENSKGREGDHEMYGVRRIGGAEEEHHGYACLGWHLVARG